MPNNLGMKSTKQLIDEFGGTCSVARFVGVSPPTVSEWKSKKSIPEGPLSLLAPEFEIRGIATRKELFPKDYEKRWPDLRPDVDWAFLRNGGSK